MVMPPDVTATKELGSPSEAVPPASVESDGIAVGAKGFPSPSQDAQGEKLAKISPPMTLKSPSSDGSCRSGVRPGVKSSFIDSPGPSWHLFEQGCENPHSLS